MNVLTKGGIYIYIHTHIYIHNIYIYIYTQYTHIHNEILLSFKKERNSRTFLAVQWLRLYASTAWGMGSISSQGTKIPLAGECSQKKKKERNSDTFYIT